MTVHFNNPLSSDRSIFSSLEDDYEYLLYRAKITNHSLQLIETHLSEYNDKFEEYKKTCEKLKELEEGSPDLLSLYDLKSLSQSIESLIRSSKDQVLENSLIIPYSQQIKEIQDSIGYTDLKKKKTELWRSCMKTYNAEIKIKKSQILLKQEAQNLFERIKKIEDQTLKRNQEVTSSLEIEDNCKDV